MTDAKAEKVREFLTVSSGRGAGWGSGAGAGWGSGRGAGAGWGSGDGTGWGDGTGFGDGTGTGWGDGWGAGSSAGSGDGWGWDDDIIMFNGMTVYQVDDMPTVITAVRGNLARGYILRGDLTLQPCRIAKVGDKFAHGETAREALDAAREKLFDDMSEEERIAAFWDAHVAGVKYPARDFFDWHHRLTGSCEMGRNEFCRGHGIDLEKGMYTVEEFVAMTRDSYGGAVVERLMEGKSDVH